MYSLKGSDDLKIVKKGSACFCLSTDQSGTTSGTNANIFETQLFNDSYNITKLSSTQVKLKANIKYKISISLTANSFSVSTTGYQWWAIYNLTTSSYVSSSKDMLLMPTTRVDDYWAPNGSTEMYFSPTVDTSLILYCSGANGTANLYGNGTSRILIEEIETYTTLVPNILDKMIGVNQSWQDVTSSRVSGTTYTNTFGKPIEVAVMSSQDTLAKQLHIVVDGVTRQAYNLPSGIDTRVSLTQIIPNLSTYSVTATGTTISRWSELR